ncbi:MAG: GNAT family N-acetyltransferase [Desulfobacterales bacterium]|jgi:ribosomal protein S18 acetylase RimI-like enzyme
MITSKFAKLQPATPDSYEIAWQLIYDTHPFLFDYLFNNDRDLMKSCLSDWWQRPEGWFSHAACTAAIYEGTLVGIEIGFARLELQNNTRPTFTNAEQTMKPAEAHHFSNAFRNYVPYLFPFVPDEAYYIQSLATVAEIRGQGIGELLLNNAFTYASEKGLKSCQLDVLSDSVAVNFYRQMGMEVIAITRVPYLEKNYGISMHYRMRKNLE